MFFFSFEDALFQNGYPLFSGSVHLLHQISSEIYRVLPSWTGFDWVSLDSTGLDQVELSRNRFYRVLLGIIAFLMLA